MVAAGWTEAQKRAYVLADNQLAITGSGWDPELLRLELGELKLAGFDLSLTGFGDLELKDQLTERTAGLTDPDDAPAAPEHPVSAAGDLWMATRKIRRISSSPPDPATRYARAVDPGEILAGPLVRAACRRDLADLRTSPKSLRQHFPRLARPRARARGCRK